MEGFSMAKLINQGWAKPGDEIPQPVGAVLGGNLRRMEERERLVAEIKKHHPKATTEQIVRDLEDWGE
jgi:hypothetical protein